MASVVSTAQWSRWNRPTTLCGEGGGRALKIRVQMRTQLAMESPLQPFKWLITLLLAVSLRSVRLALPSIPHQPSRRIIAAPFD